MKFLSIDGGGTKTEFIIVDELGNILAHSIKASCHYKQTSLENYKEVLNSGIEDVLSQINIDISHIDYAVFGIPGYGEIYEDFNALISPIENILPREKFKIVNDAVVAWAGSLALSPGINIVAGTGAIGFGMDKYGKDARSSGWGDFIGDEGSAYWLGKRLLEAFTKQSDGRHERTPLYSIVKEELELEDDFSILDLVLNKYKKDRTQIAQLSKILYKSAINEDEVAMNIYKDAAFEHFLMIRALVEKLEFDNDKEIPISYSGGVFKARDFVLNPLNDYLSTLPYKIRLIEPILPPILGGAIYAIELSGRKISKEIIEKIKIQLDVWNLQ